MSELTIVTAFFDIGRANWKGFERNSNKYVEYFKFWARIKNKLVVYTDEATAQQVWKIREEYGLKNQTQVIIVNEIDRLDPEVASQLNQVVANETLLKFRERPENPESYSAKYNYVTYLKPYFIADAVKKQRIDGMIAWVDFGYNHNGEAYPDTKEFDFLWEYDFSEHIHIFTTQDIDDMPIFDIIHKMRVYISGGIIVAPALLWTELATLFRQSILHLTHCGLADADQTLLVMAYREKPSLFSVHAVMDWFMVFKEFGAKHLSIKHAKPLYKTYKREARKHWQERKYQEAIKWYLKYGKEKIWRCPRQG